MRREGALEGVIMHMEPCMERQGRLRCDVAGLQSAGSFLRFCFSLCGFISSQSVCHRVVRSATHRVLHIIMSDSDRVWLLLFTTAP